MKRIWTEREKDFLIFNHGHMTMQEIGKRLGRSRAAVLNKSSELSLRKQQLWTAPEVHKLKLLLKANLSIRKIAILMHRTEFSIAKMISRGKLR